MPYPRPPPRTCPGAPALDISRRYGFKIAQACKVAAFGDMHADLHDRGGGAPGEGGGNGVAAATEGVRLAEVAMVVAE